MNILPKKSWHVRNKDNIARVRRDEAEAAEKEKEEKKRVELADREARLTLLKHKNRQELASRQIKFEPVLAETPAKAPISSGHINLFDNFDKSIKTTNREHDKEVSEKKEEYEKKIGYLTYLGQDTNEALKKKNWYEVLPEERTTQNDRIKDTHDKLILKDKDGKPIAKALDEKDGEMCWEAKQRLDPLSAFRRYCFSSKNCKQSGHDPQTQGHQDYTPIVSRQKNHKSKQKKHKREKDDEKQKKLQKLREARLKREEQERRRTEQFLKGELQDNLVMNNNKAREQPTSRVTPKYNSQFNPELARQNFTR